VRAAPEPPSFSALITIPVVVYAGDGNAQITSDHTTNPEHVDTHHLASCDGLARLSLTPSRCAQGALPGAWWKWATGPGPGNTTKTSVDGSTPRALTAIHADRG